MLKGETVKVLGTIAAAFMVLLACGAPSVPTAPAAPTVLVAPTSAAVTAPDPTNSLPPEPAAAPAITCVGVGDETCQEMVTLVRGAYPAQVAAASAIIVADTCPPASLCDRLYPFDAAVIVVPVAKADTILALHVFGLAKPEQIELWKGALPEHVAALMPGR